MVPVSNAPKTQRFCMKLCELGIWKLLVTELLIFLGYPVVQFFYWCCLNYTMHFICLKSFDISWKYVIVSKLYPGESLKRKFDHRLPKQLFELVTWRSISPKCTWFSMNSLLNLTSIVTPPRKLSEIVANSPKHLCKYPQAP